MGVSKAVSKSLPFLVIFLSPLSLNLSLAPTTADEATSKLGPYRELLKILRL
jgi:hypothetical protein